MGRINTLETDLKLNIVQLSKEEVLPIRHLVLWPEKSPEFCKVEGDEDALHFGLLQNDNLVCVASIYMNKNSARLRKFATLVPYQGKGLGSFLLNNIFDSLKEQEVTHFWCDARVESAGFYAKLGLKTKGEQFYKSELPYIIMEKSL